jgi:hypothetical protein
MNALFGQLALDRNAGDVGGDIDEARLGVVWFAHVLRIHRERAEDRATVRKNRRRPAGAKSVREGQVPIILPQWIRHNVGDDDGRPPMGGSAARASIGTDRHAVNHLRVGVRQTRRSAVPQPAARFVKQQDRPEDSL